MSHQSFGSYPWSCYTIPMPDQPFVSVIIPAYNEERNVSAGTLQIVADYFFRQTYQSEIIIVDDGSTDKTVELINAFITNYPNFRVIKNPHKGKAFAVHTGVEQAQGKYILFTDLDQATPPEEIEKLVPFVSMRGYDIAIGSREIMGSRRDAEPLIRHIMGKGFNFIVQLIAVHNIHDTQCGFKLFNAGVAKQLFAALQVYKDDGKPVIGARVTAFDVELLFLAQKWHKRIAEVPVFWHYVKSERVNAFKDSYRMFVEVVAIRFKDLSGAYAKPSKSENPA